MRVPVRPTLRIVFIYLLMSVGGAVHGGPLDVSPLLGARAAKAIRAKIREQARLLSGDHTEDRGELDGNVYQMTSVTLSSATSVSVGIPLILQIRVTPLVGVSWSRVPRKKEAEGE